MWYVPMVMWSWSYGFVAETGGREYRSRHPVRAVVREFQDGDLVFEVHVVVKARAHNLERL